ALWPLSAISSSSATVLTRLALPSAVAGSFFPSSPSPFYSPSALSSAKSAEMSQDLPHGESWFSFFGFHDTFLENARRMQAAMSPDGLTWYAHEEVGVQHVFGLLTVLAVLLFFGIRTYSQIKDTEAAIVPEGKFSIRTFVELFTGYVYNQMASMMGKDA